MHTTKAIVKLKPEKNLGQGPFLEGPEKFSHLESRSKISNPTITELLYSRIPNMKRGSLHKKSFRRMHLFVLRDRLVKNGFQDRKSYRGF